MIASVEPAKVSPPVQPTPKAKPNTIETLQKTVSASRLNTWLQCRLKFWFRYVQQISKPKTPSLHVGSVVHLILQAWNMARWRKQGFNLDTFKKLFEEGWKDQATKINWEGEEDDQRKTAWSVLEMYFAQTPIKANEMPEAVEVPMETDLSKYGLPTLIGVLDLVRAGGRIVDFKSTGIRGNAVLFDVLRGFYTIGNCCPVNSSIGDVGCSNVLDPSSLCGSTRPAVLWLRTNIAECRRSPTLREFVAHFAGRRGRRPGISSDEPLTCAHGGRVCKMPDASPSLVQVAMTLHPSARTKGDAKTS